MTTDAAHTIVKAAERLGWDMGDIDKFTQQVQHVEYGLSAEVEFAAILRWLGWCSFVHRLNEDLLEDPARSSWTVPDLFAIFQANGKTCSALIEVKTTQHPTLRFKASYLQRLLNYSALLKQPLLVAWRPRALGFWMMFDPRVGRALDDGSIEVDFSSAVQNDLMSLLAGDYYLTPKEGAGLRIQLDRIGEKEHTSDGYEAVFQVSDAYFHDAAGDRAEPMADSVVWAIFSTLKNSEEVRDDRIVLSFVASGGMTRAQLVLRTAVAFSLKMDERINWKTVGQNLDAILKSEDLLHDSQASFGTFIKYIIYQQPRKIPPFLPQGWAGRSTQDPSTRRSK